MHDSYPIQRALMYGVSVLVYCKMVQPEVSDLHNTVVNMDRIATLMMKRGDLKAPSKYNNRKSSYNSRQFSNNFETPDDNSNYRFN